MSDAPSAPTRSHVDSPSATDATITFALNQTGTILAAQRTAAPHWPGESLTGRLFTSLFVFEVVSRDPFWERTQWDVLVATATSHALRITTKAEQAPSTDFQLSFEPTLDGGYLATLRPAPIATAGSRSPFVTAPSVAPTESDTRPPFGPASHDPAPTSPWHTSAQALANESPVGLFELDFKTGRVAYSPSWKRQLGYLPDELPDTYETWQSRLHLEDTAAAPDRTGRRTTQASRTFAADYRLRHKDGHYVWLHGIGTQYFAIDGSLTRVVGTQLDITERKESEDQTLLTEERLAWLAHDGNLAAFDFDLVAQRYWYSPAWHRLLGTADDGGAPDSTPFLRALPETAAEDGLEPFFLAPAIGRPGFVVPITLRTGSGAPLNAILGAHRHFTRQRTLARVVGYFAPLPPGAAQSAGGSLPQATLETALDALGEAVLIVDALGNVRYLNPQAEKLIGLRRADTQALRVGDVFRLVDQHDRRPAPDAVDQLLSADGPPRLCADHALLRAGSDAPVPIVWTARQTWNDQGQATGTIIVFRDPGEMTLTPEELVRANRFDTLGQLAGGIAHDFNNLLTTILGGISQAKDHGDARGLKGAEEACFAAKTLTKQLLTFAKGGAGAGLQDVWAAAVLHEAVRIGGAGTTTVINLDVPDTLGPIRVDRAQLLQVFQNLVINALQAMPDPAKGRLRIQGQHTELLDGDIPALPAGTYVQIDVQDNGAGISAENLQKIWAPFFTTKKHGTGLGLATVLSIVRRHGGHIGVRSQLGSGTTFTVFLPRAEIPADNEARPAEARRIKTGRVLVMDDDPGICDLTAGMLASLDYNNDTARSGEEAIQLYRRYFNVGRPYDAVLLDLTVPGGIGGEEVFKTLKEIDPGVRAIVSSGYDREGMARRYLDLGFSGYLPKPYRAADLGRVLKTVLG